LRDGHSKEVAVAASEVHNFDNRRKYLISVNPWFAKNSDLPPMPSVEDITHEHFSLNLPLIAKSTLKELDENNEDESILDSENDNTDELKESSDISEIKNENIDGEELKEETNDNLVQETLEYNESDESDDNESDDDESDDDESDDDESDNDESDDENNY
jgi:hypothetical protein